MNNSNTIATKRQADDTLVQIICANHVGRNHAAIDRKDGLEASTCDPRCGCSGGGSHTTADARRYVREQLEKRNPTAATL